MSLLRVESFAQCNHVPRFESFELERVCRIYPSRRLFSCYYSMQKATQFQFHYTDPRAPTWILSSEIKWKRSVIVPVPRQQYKSGTSRVQQSIED